MKIVPRRFPVTLSCFLLAVICVASPFVLQIDIIELDIKFLQVLEHSHLDNIFVGLVLIFVGIGVDRALEFRRSANALWQSQRHLEDAVLQFVDTMAQALDARDKYTAGHSDRVSANSTVVAEAMGLSLAEVEIVRIGARLHDIGKIGIPDTVLQKPDKLSDGEYELIKLHPQIGKRILERVERFGAYLPIVELHHEDYDGGGYPYGLNGENVPLGARIVHVADVFDAITSNRAYRKAMPKEEVLGIMASESGQKFDPSVLKVFLEIWSQGRLAQAVLEQELKELVFQQQL